MCPLSETYPRHFTHQFKIIFLKLNGGRSWDSGGLTAEWEREITF
jgi:hypothetical protein